MGRRLPLLSSEATSQDSPAAAGRSPRNVVHKTPRTEGAFNDLATRFAGNYSALSARGVQLSDFLGLHPAAPRLSGDVALLLPFNPTRSSIFHDSASTFICSRSSRSEEHSRFALPPAPRTNTAVFHRLRRLPQADGMARRGARVTEPILSRALPHILSSTGDVRAIVRRFAHGHECRD
jgi:hypothetical protein